MLINDRLRAEPQVDYSRRVWRTSANETAIRRSLRGLKRRTKRTKTHSLVAAEMAS